MKKESKRRRYSQVEADYMQAADPDLRKMLKIGGIVGKQKPVGTT
jgi:hypothetical protein